MSGNGDNIDEHNFLICFFARSVPIAFIMIEVYATLGGDLPALRMQYNTRRPFLVVPSPDKEENGPPSRVPLAYFIISSL